MYQPSWARKYSRFLLLSLVVILPLKGLSMSSKLEDNKGVIRTPASKKNRQRQGQKKKDKKTNNDLQNIHITLKIEQQEHH